MKRILYHTQIGTLLLISNQGKLVYCNWVSEDCRRKQVRIEELVKNDSETSKDNEILDETIRQLEEYFSCKRKKFELPICLTGTEFQKRIWTLLSTVTYGKVISYKDLAERAGNPKAVRALAGACGTNPLAIILPCHRIVASKGKMGGYTGGIDKKLALLRHEQVDLW